MLPVEEYIDPAVPFERQVGVLRRSEETSTTIGPTSASSSTSSTSLEEIVTATRPSEDFGNIGTVTLTLSSTVPPGAPSPADYGNVDKSITFTEPAFTAAPDDHGNVRTVVITESNTTPQTPTYVPAAVSTLTNSLGVATQISTSIPSAISIPMTTILTNSLGQPTVTAVTSVLVTPIFSTLTDADGVTTATITSYPVFPSDTVRTQVFYISYAEYFVGFFLPTVCSILIAIPIRVLDLNAKLFQPWHELTHAHGATGRESLCLETSGWQSVVTSVRSLFGGQALVFLTTSLVMCSSLVVPLSAEAVALKLRGDCRPGSMSAKNCAYELSVFAQPAKATMGLLSFMALTVIMLIFFLGKWQSGVSTNPWSIWGIAGLSQNKDVRSLFTSALPDRIDVGHIPERLLKDLFDQRKFKLGWFRDEKFGLQYGIMLHDQYPAGHPLHTRIREMQAAEKPRNHGHVNTRQHQPFWMLGYFGRSLFLLVLLGILALILYYNNTGGDTPFERFMNSESFGVKFLFTAVGVIITFFWSSFFSSIATMSPYHLLATRPQLARHSILLSSPTNAFSGIISGFRRRHAFLALVGLTAVLSEFLTLFLSNIPFRVTQTYLVARICTWSAVGILAIMLLVVGGSFFCKWPHMPVDPSTIAGSMYYVCDSWMMTCLENISASDKKERDWRVALMGERYEFGEITGQNGTVRIGVDNVAPRC
ncbi:hypothetical protein BKA67DRAFT_524614 [Truncatella angustata]|uniref:Uncharacterized protein n=1 Tax=Truncatella angustata TaxID=152316 RepID=A0A9P8RIN3_9PEZI|nr:uncharacterized protein BKA67DRAFT_524614 [Truncatella angustata]KAH6646743.1 hypothetical protein BKA67DRAFT_524614 [Truncatella angustata]